MASAASERPGTSIWWYAFGYFIAYAPYTALTKALSSGTLPNARFKLDGFSILPASTLAGILVLYTYITLKGWWQHAHHVPVAGRSIPLPDVWTWLSALCSALILLTTTLAYTFTGVSIVFVMLLMRGGVLVIAPLVDALSHRHTHWYSWAGLGFSLMALLAAFGERAEYRISLLCAVDIAIYILAYFVRLRVMSSRAKSHEPNANLKYFVGEQMASSPLALLLLAFGAVLVPGDVGEQLRYGFVDIWGTEAVVAALVVGALSALTGIFGSLTLLAPQENTFCVPVNRSSSILAGLVASYGLYFVLNMRQPTAGELAGAAFIIAAILFLTLPPMWERRVRAVGTSTT